MSRRFVVHLAPSDDFGINGGVLKIELSHMQMLQFLKE